MEQEPVRSKAFPIVEIFGPTIQGEGPDAGLPVVFIRTGGCDYQCSWCDSLHAVLPEHVRKAERLTATEIARRVSDLVQPPITVVISGGNPLLLDLQSVVDALHDRGYRVSVETQATRLKPWIKDVDLVVMSPKPPSSLMPFKLDIFDRFVDQLDADQDRAIKVVVGDETDYEFARDLRKKYWRENFYVSALNASGSDVDEFDVMDVLSRYKWLCEKVAADKEMFDVIVLPQLHTLAWGSEQGR